MNLLACSASVAFILAQANCLSLGDINSSQLVDSLCSVACEELNHCLFD